MNPYRMGIEGMYQKPDAYNPYAAGAKKYGLSGRSAPNVGPTDFEGMKGYHQRDQKAQARKQAALQMMQAAQKSQYMNPAYLRGQASGKA
jgi:hypothetical protein